MQYKQQHYIDSVHQTIGLQYIKALNSLSSDKILDWSKLKAFADNKMKLAKMVIFVFGRAGNIMGKGENAGYQHFLLFETCFPKAFYSGSFKVRIVR